MKDKFDKDKMKKVAMKEGKALAILMDKHKDVFGEIFNFLISNDIHEVEVGTSKGMVTFTSVLAPSKEEMEEVSEAKMNPDGTFKENEFNAEDIEVGDLVLVKTQGKEKDGPLHDVIMQGRPATVKDICPGRCHVDVELTDNDGQTYTAFLSVEQDIIGHYKSLKVKK